MRGGKVKGVYELASDITTLGWTVAEIERQLTLFKRQVEKETWEKASEDLAHGLPAPWKQTVRARCAFKAKERA